MMFSSRNDCGLAILILFLVRCLFLTWVYPACGSLFPIKVQRWFFALKFQFGSLVLGAGNLDSFAKPAIRWVWTLKMVVSSLSSKVSLGPKGAPEWVFLRKGASCILEHDQCGYFTVCFDFNMLLSNVCSVFGLVYVMFLGLGPIMYQVPAFSGFSGSGYLRC